MKIKYSAPYDLEQHGDWIDLKTVETVKADRSRLQMINLGFNIQLPKGLTMLVLPRSSTPKKFGIGLSNNMGIIDASYNGRDDIVKFPAFAYRTTQINKGQRIAQFTIQPAMNCPLWTRLRFILTGVKLVKVPIESNTNKNRGGFGSSGH